MEKYICMYTHTHTLTHTYIQTQSHNSCACKYTRYADTHSLALSDGNKFLLGVPFAVFRNILCVSDARVDHWATVGGISLHLSILPE